MAANPLQIDRKSGFCSSNSTFYSKRKPIPLPPNPFLDVTTFISSHSHRGSTALIDASSGLHVPFPELWRSVDSLASRLSAMGIRKGDVVLLLSPNSISFPVVCLAVMSLGAVITTTNPLNTASEIAKQIADSKPVLAFTTPDLAPKLAAAASSLSLVLIEDAAPQSFRPDGSNGPAPKAKIITTLREMIASGPEASGRRVRERVDQNDTATLLYSSGTTGASKGVVSSHRSLIAMVQTVLNRSNFFCPFQF